jgi:hypothetical protein
MTSVDPWNEIFLIVVYDLLNVMLDSVSTYFIEDICIYVHQGYWSITFFDLFICGFGIKTILPS